MKPPAKNDPSQLAFPLFIPTVTNLGNGTFKVEMGKPLFWISAKKLAGEFGVTDKSVYRWREDGTIPEKTVPEGKEEPRLLYRASGIRRWQFSTELIPILRAQFRELHS
jgi:hypothetical protein